MLLVNLALGLLLPRGCQIKTSSNNATIQSSLHQVEFEKFPFTNTESADKTWWAVAAGETERDSASHTEKVQEIWQFATLRDRLRIMLGKYLVQKLNEDYWLFLTHPGLIK